MINKVKGEVKKLLGDSFDHGFEHAERVYQTAMMLCDASKASMEIVALAALLHDVDDYKLFGQESSDNLTNAKIIMIMAEIDSSIQNAVCEIIKSMGYSKAMAGIRPKTLEGQIVSDADMLDACGVIGSLRTLIYTVTKGSGVVFNKDIFPDEDLTAEAYKSVKRKSDSYINHHFDKLFKLKNLMFTESGKKEAEIRQKDTMALLRAFFREQGANDWIEYLEKFCSAIPVIPSVVEESSTI